MILRKRVNEIVNVAKPGDSASRVFDISILALIALNILAMILKSIQPLGDDYATVFYWIECISVVVFTVEYVSRLWSCVEEERYRHRILGRLKMASTALMVIDLLAILPFYLPFLGVDLRFLRTLRLARVFRVAKLGRYSRSLQTLKRVITAKRSELVVVAFVTGILLVLSSSVIYFAENKAQPEAFASIPAAMWWSVVTLTTVGYGDVSPVTPLGKLFASVVAVLGVGMVALPTGIISAGFLEEVSRSKNKATECPHCGKEIK